jgi:plastocyanin
VRLLVRLWRLVVVGCALGLVGMLGGCALWGPEGGPGGAGLAAPTSSASPAAVDAVLGADGVQRVEISAGDDLRFSPSVVRARTGVIDFVFHNTGTTPHAVEVAIAPTATDSAAVGTGNLNGGQTQTVRVTVNKPGTYPFPCVYHVSSGMQGTLEVIASPRTPPASPI